MAQGIQDLLLKKAISLVPREERSKGLFSIIFLVQKVTGGFRLVLDLKRLNRFITKVRFKMETLQRIIPLMSPNHYMCTLDLQDAYYHILIFKVHRIYLRFSVQGLQYQYNVFPFGLKTAPRVFTKVVAPLVASLHLQGIRLYPYLDDWLVHSPSASQLLLELQRVCLVVQEHGFLLYIKKCNLSPSLDVTFIRARFRTDLNKGFLPDSRGACLCLSRH